MRGARGSVGRDAVLRGAGPSPEEYPRKAPRDGSGGSPSHAESIREAQKRPGRPLGLPSGLVCSRTRRAINSVGQSASLTRKKSWVRLPHRPSTLSGTHRRGAGRCDRSWPPVQTGRWRSLGWGGSGPPGKARPAGSQFQEAEGAASRTCWAKPGGPNSEGTKPERDASTGRKPG